MFTFGLFQLASLRSTAVPLQSISTTWPTTDPAYQAPSLETVHSPRPLYNQHFLPSKIGFSIFLRCEPLGGRAQGGGRFRLLAAGGSDIRDASPVLFEPDACDWSGGPITGRVHRAPGYQNRQGYRCAASASSQARPPGPGPQATSPHRDTQQKKPTSPTLGSGEISVQKPGACSRRATVSKRASNY